jgi:hypothetical protein
MGHGSVSGILFFWFLLEICWIGVDDGFCIGNCLMDCSFEVDVDFYL